MPLNATQNRLFEEGQRKQYYRIMAGEHSRYAGDCFKGEFIGVNFGFGQDLSEHLQNPLAEPIQFQNPGFSHLPEAEALEEPIGKKPHRDQQQNINQNPGVRSGIPQNLSCRFHCLPQKSDGSQLKEESLFSLLWFSNLMAW